MKILGHEPQTLKWNFPSTNTGEEDGVNNSLMFYFAGDHEHFIAREAIQNSIDARLPNDDPVIVEFEILEMPKHVVPGVDYLEVALQKAKRYTAGSERSDQFYSQAIKVLQKEAIPVLRIGDYNTTGLRGEDDDRLGEWNRLVRTSGASTQSGAGGGSYGIGKGAPFVASSLRTVFYSTKSENDGVAFQGKARISSFADLHPRDVRRGVGDFGLAFKDEYVTGIKAVRDLSLIPPVFRREQQGTDIFIIGYETNKSDWRRRLIHSVLNNFWAAIHFTNLEVQFKDNGETIRITSENLHDFLKEYWQDPTDALHFYESVISPDQKWEAEIPEIGKVSLYVKTGDDYPKAVQMMRSPLMVVYSERGYRVLPQPYVAVFICEDNAGNKLLRNLEPPAHNKWQPELDENNPIRGRRVHREVTSWIRERLKEFAQQTNENAEQIPGLSKYLGIITERDDLAVNANQGSKADRVPSEEETAIETGALIENATEVTTPTARKIVTVSSAARGTDTSRGGIADHTNETHDDRASENEDGKFPRLDLSSVMFRAFSKRAGDGFEYTVILHPEEDVAGAVRLWAIGDGENYPAPIASASYEDGSKVKIAGASLVNLELTKGKPQRINVKLQSNKRYTLGVDESGN